MTVSPVLREKVRKRAGFRCQYCGITETDSGGELTIDHFKPESVGGDNNIRNLVYACFRCNIYKSKFWNDSTASVRLFNPNNDNYEDHFLLSASGVLVGVTEVGDFTINLLRLNRPELVKKRHDRVLRNEEKEVLKLTKDSVEILKRLTRQQHEMLEKQQTLLEQQKRLLDILFKK